MQIHIFTGLVGSFLVLLHSSWKLSGMAGAVMLMTMVIVASGFVGRYIYTTIPRTPEGAELPPGDLEAQIEAANTQLQTWAADRPGAAAALAERLAAARRLLALWRATHEPLGVVLFILAFVHIGGALYYFTLSR